MHSVFAHQHYELRAYRALIKELGGLQPDQSATGKVFGTYKYIVIEDLDEKTVVTLENVLVYVRGAPSLKEGAEVRFVIGMDPSGKSPNGILSVARDGSISDDYQYFYAQFEGELKKLQGIKRKTLKSSVFCIFAGVVFSFFIYPVIIFGIMFFLSLLAASLVSSAINKVRAAVLTHDEYRDRAYPFLAPSTPVGTA